VKFERIDTRTIFEGRIITVREDRFRYADGGEADREIVGHKGAVAVVAHDGEHVYLVRQPREAVDASDLLELPAGLLDKEGESPEETGRRELAEEIGKAADHWELLHVFHPSVGFSDETVHLFLATGLRDVPQPDSGEDERIEIVAWPLADLDRAIDECRDSKTLIGLLELRRR
jgi:8-oxo-dGTP pyrophosphatase MutT (NUDIX family)